MEPSKERDVEADYKTSVCLWNCLEARLSSFRELGASFLSGKSQEWPCARVKLAMTACEVRHLSGGDGRC